MKITCMVSIIFRVAGMNFKSEYLKVTLVQSFFTTFFLTKNEVDYSSALRLYVLEQHRNSYHGLSLKNSMLIVVCKILNKTTRNKDYQH